MRVLILGATGMLGHKLSQVWQDRFDTWTAIRSSYHTYAQYDLFDPQRLVSGVDALNFDTIVQTLATVKPDVVINCIGIIKQLPTAKDPIVSLTINSLMPHRLAALCQTVGARLLHISTDCVFSGRKGMYTENDISDAEDLYGRSKFLGEVNASGCLTLRTSIIGRELQTSNGLVEWFLGSQGGNVHGYTKAIYSGFTTLALADIMADIIEHHPALSGIYQVSSEPITKYALLCLLRDAFGLDIDIKPYPDVQINRSLDSSRFRTATGFAPLDWTQMVHQMTTDLTPYSSKATV